MKVVQCVVSLLADERHVGVSGLKRKMMSVVMIIGNELMRRRRGRVTMIVCKI